MAALPRAETATGTDRHNGSPIKIIFWFDFQSNDFLVNKIWEASTTKDHNDAHTIRFTMSSDGTHGDDARKRKRDEREPEVDAGEAIPGLPNHLVVEHILRSDNFDDPADLARLPAVSRAMRDAVAATGLQLKELTRYRAADLGCLSAVQRLQRGGRLSRRERLCEAAARGGHLEALKGLRDNGCPWDEKTCWAAARGGHLKVLQWLRTNGCPWDKVCVRWGGEGLLFRCCSGRTRTAASGTEKRARARRRAVTSRFCSCCALTAARGTNGRSMGRRRAGTLRCCSGRARTAARGTRTHTCSAAALGGHLEVLQWARANGCPWDRWTCTADYAARGGSIEVLEWLRTNGCPWDSKTCKSAAEGGHLEVLQWLRANGCPWNEGTEKAAEGGHLEVLQWLRANGCPWDKKTSSGAASSGHLRCFSGHA